MDVCLHPGLFKKEQYLLDMGENRVVETLCVLITFAFIYTALPTFIS